MILSPYQRDPMTDMDLLLAPAVIARSKDVLLLRREDRSVDRRASVVLKRDNNNVVVEDSLRRSRKDSHASVVPPLVDRDNSVAEEVVVSPLPMRTMKCSRSPSRVFLTLM